MVFKNFTQLALKQFDRVLTRDFTAQYRLDGRVSKVKIDLWAVATICKHRFFIALLYCKHRFFIALL